jgi:hypothetical protein
MTWEDDEIKAMAERLTRYCKCKHMLLAHKFVEGKTNEFYCSQCKCQQFKQMSNMEWLVMKGSQVASNVNKLE